MRKLPPRIALSIYFVFVSIQAGWAQSPSSNDLFLFAAHWTETSVVIGPEPQDFEVFDLLCLLAGNCEVEERTIWYVDNTAPAGGDGSMANPFDSLMPVNGTGGGGDVDSQGDIIFLFQGSGAYDSGILLEDNQDLIGQGVDLSVAGQTVVTGSEAQTPTITNGSGSGIDLASNNTVRGLDISNVSTFGIFANGSDSATVEKVNINNPGVSGIDLLGTSGTFTFTDTTINGAGTAGLRMNGGSSNVTFNGASSITQGIGAGINISGGHTGSLTFDTGTTITDTGGAGLDFGDGLLFDDADGTYAFRGTANLGGDITGGISIFGPSTGTFTFGENTMIDPSFEIFSAVLIDGGLDQFGGTFNYDGSISTQGGQLITVSETAPGSVVNFNNSGANTLTNANNANNGITVDIDSAGDVTFTDTTINVTDPSTQGFQVVVGDHPGTIRFTNLNITTNGNQDHAFFIGNTELSLAMSVGTLIVDGDSNITTDGDGAVRLKNIDNIDVTFNNITANDPVESTAGNPPIAGIEVENVAGGMFTANSLTATNAKNALKIDGSGADFTFEDITSTNSTEQGVKIENYSGTFLLSEGDDDLDEDILTIDGTGDGFAGIDIADSSTATFINSTNGDGINSTNTDLVVTFARIGEIGTILGDGIEITNNDGQTRTADIIFNNVFGLGVPDPTGRGIFIDVQSGTLNADLNANFFATEQTTIATQDGGAENSLILDLTGNSTLTTFMAQPTMSVIGSGLHSTIVRDWDFPNQVIGGITDSSGILFDRVTFDADGDPSNGIQQVVFGAGDLDIGQVPPFTIQRVNGDGLSFINCTGDLRIEILNIANENGTGLLVDTKGLGTTFNLDVGGGTIDTINGAATNLDPLTGHITLDAVDVDGSPTNGIIVDVFEGTFTVNGGTIKNTNCSAVMLNEAAEVVLNNMTISGPSVGDGDTAPAISVNNNSVLTLRDATVTAGGGGDGTDDIGSNIDVDGSSTVTELR